MCDKESDICSICLSEMQTRGGDAVVCPGCCGAWFHQKCINDVLLLSRDTRCPLCRATFPVSLVASIERRTVCTRHFVSHITYSPVISALNNRSQNYSDPTTSNNYSNNYSDHTSHDMASAGSGANSAPNSSPPPQLAEVSILDSIERYYASGEREDGYVGYLPTPLPRDVNMSTISSSLTPPPVISTEATHQDHNPRGANMSSVMSTPTPNLNLSSIPSPMLYSTLSRDNQYQNYRHAHSIYPTLNPNAPRFVPNNNHYAPRSNTISNGTNGIYPSIQNNHRIIHRNSNNDPRDFDGNMSSTGLNRSNSGNVYYNPNMQFAQPEIAPSPWHCPPSPTSAQLRTCNNN